MIQITLNGKEVGEEKSQDKALVFAVKHAIKNCDPMKMSWGRTTSSDWTCNTLSGNVYTFIDKKDKKRRAEEFLASCSEAYEDSDAMAGAVFRAFNNHITEKQVDLLNKIERASLSENDKAMTIIGTLSNKKS